MTSLAEKSNGADPRLSANIYCAGHLDRVAAEVILPLWRRLEAERADGSAWLWIMRYGKCGEHLKLRLHDPGEILDLDAIKGEVEAAASRLFANLEEAGEQSGGEESKVQTAVPPIDVEDRQKEPREDRSVLWTEYLRHRLSLGDAEMYDDDRYCVLFTRALAGATSIFLEALEEVEPEAVEAGRLATLFTGVTAALWSLDMDRERRASYLAYHRDWLLRFSLTPRDPKVDPADQSRARFDQKLAGMAAEKRQGLLQRAWRFDSQPMEGEVATFSRAVVELEAYAGPIVRALARPLDPRAVDYFDSVLFKVLQGFSNATGLRVFEEAWVHHLLHAAMLHPPAREGE